ncbi:MAG: 4Fe-4S dicluster domain-containing protein [Dehalococcoidia bacterium]|nr:4Fe-4S dicluster domain-containing protein [Dehalococcoidia bacterium]
MASDTPWPLPLDAPAADDLSRCVHCGLCLNSCPTFSVTGLEAESPRGRIYLARAVDEGRLEMTPAVQAHWDLCLQCRACEAVCPSGVAYGRIMEHVRAQVAAAPKKDRLQRRLRSFALRNVVARPRVLAAMVAPARWYAGSPLRGLVRRTRLLRSFGRLAVMEAQLPRRPGKPVRPGDTLAAPLGAAARVTLFTGCVMSELFGGVHRATARVLARSHVAAVATPGQVCCGALHAHDGDLAFARDLARKNIDALEGGDIIVVNSAGCGAAMKEYGQLLAHDPDYAARAAAFAARVRDFSEYVVTLPGRPAGQLDARVAYQDACHLAHAQRIREQPRALLREVQGCTPVATAGADMCCGAAGIYSLVEPGMSAELRARKAAQFREHAPDVVVTANPGCQMQYEAAVREAGLDARVMHLAELLDEAQRNARRR